MALIDWGPALQVGVKAIDHQHKKLVDAANRLYDAMMEGKGQEATGTVLNDLIVYTQYHFNTEEALQQIYGYPGLAVHKAEHARLVELVLQFKAKYDSGDESISVELLGFLRVWLTRHIMQDDREMAGHLNGKGVK